MQGLYTIGMHLPETNQWVRPICTGDFYPVIYYSHFESIKDAVSDDIQKLLYQARIGIDLGSGSNGYSAINLLRLCPNLGELHTIDAVFDCQITNSPASLNHQHHRQFIGDFLQDPPVRADVALFCSVPDHQVTTPERKKALYDALLQNGIVISIGPDTNLHLSEADGFSVVYENLHTLVKVWKKIPLPELPPPENTN